MSHSVTYKRLISHPGFKNEAVGYTRPVQENETPYTYLYTTENNIGSHPRWVTETVNFAQPVWQPCEGGQ